MAFLLSVATMLAPSASVFAASTVGTNLQTDGLLSVTGASTLTGAVGMTAGFNAVASSTVGDDLTVSGDMLVSSTLQSTGLATFTSGFLSMASSTVGNSLNVTGAFRASSTLEVTGLAQGDKILKVMLPNFIVAQIISTEQGIRGDSTRSGTKPGRIETGAVIQIPLFINVNEWVKVDTRTGEYVERVQR